MEPIKCNLEPQGLDTLIVGLKFPAYRENKLMKTLYVALSLEWACRQGGVDVASDSPFSDPDAPKAIALPFIGDLTDMELHESAGFFDAFCNSMTHQETHQLYPRTFQFCTEMLAVVVEEMDKRTPSGTTMLQ